MPYHPKKKWSPSITHRHAEEYAEQHYFRPLTSSPRSDYASNEEYQHQYVPINPDSDAPDPEAALPNLEDKKPFL